MMFEMIVGSIPVQANTDSFGGWYKAHHFQPPRSFDTVSPKFPAPPALQDLVMSCLAKAQSDRPQSVSDIIQVLTSLEQQASSAPTLLPIAQQSESKGSQEIAIAPTKNGLARPPLNTQAICPLIAWPRSKPIADIVFPHPTQINDETMAALWVMLPQSEIIKRLQNRTYNQFLFIPHPHPMLLWITALYHRAHGAKWIPYYLDLKNSQNLELLQLMAKTGFYRVLLFARESPHQASSCLFLNIAPAQRQLLQEWATLSQTVYRANDPNLSKTLLKQEYEKLKPLILSKLEVSL
jgi:serine/threonine-protein kinase